MDLQNAYREARKILKDTAAAGFQPLPGFQEKASEIIEALYVYDKNDEQFAHVAAESIPRIFAADVSRGYTLFHDKNVIKKTWEIYNRATSIVVSSMTFKKHSFRKEAPFKIACVTSIFSDHIGPSKDIADLALFLDRKLFEPLVISTNQFDTIKRLHRQNTSNEINTNTGRELHSNGIKIIGIPEQDSIVTLSKKLIEICNEENIDTVISNASMFSFPDACLAASGVALSFFDFHRGFPLYSNGIDAILHWLHSTKEKQLSPWLENGGKVIDYNYVLKVPQISRKPEANDDMVYFITASNYLERRLSDEFCSIVNKLMLEFPNVRYQLIGSCVRDEILKHFDTRLHDRFEFLGHIGDNVLLMAYFANADIYLNEFPVGGGRVVLEAMSAYLPVAAMKCGDLHVENIGAEQVGEDAINEHSPEKYYQFVKELVLSKEKRRKLGQKMRARVENVYDFKKNVDYLSEEILKIHRAKLENI